MWELRPSLGKLMTNDDVDKFPIGSRGRTVLPQLLYGSTAKRIEQLLPIPFTVVKAQKS
jgi:nucleotide-binding universal stress UspA family protein